MSDAPKLLPCPFCGGEGKYTVNPLHGDNTMASCRQCGATAFWTKWNKRSAAALTASESTVAAMRAERDTYQWADQKHSAQLVEATELVDALRAEVERLTFGWEMCREQALEDHKENCAFREQSAAEVERLTKALEPTDAQIKDATTEYLSHRGERPYRVLRGGSELWEAHAPAMREAFRAARALDRSPSVEPGNG